MEKAGRKSSHINGECPDHRFGIVKKRSVKIREDQWQVLRELFLIGHRLTQMKHG